MPLPHHSDIAAAGALAALAIFVLVRASIGFGPSFTDSGGVLPETLPQIYGWLLLGLSLLLGIEAWRRRSSAAGEDRAEPAFARTLPWGRIFGTVGALVAYALALPVAPFLPLTAAFLAGLFVLYGHRKVITVLAVAVTGAVLMDVLFIRLLNLPI